MHNNAVLAGHCLFFFLGKNNEFANSISRDEKSCNFKCLSLVLLLSYDLNHRTYCVNVKTYSALQTKDITGHLKCYICESFDNYYK